jgi:hypothetical protein
MDSTSRSCTGGRCVVVRLEANEPYGPKHGFIGRDRLRELLQRQAGQTQHLNGSSLDVGESSTAHANGLLVSEAQNTANRDDLYRTQ